MKQLDISPETLKDLQQTKAYITTEYGADIAKKIVGNIMDAIGIITTSQETEDYWEE